MTGGSAGVAGTPVIPPGGGGGGGTSTTPE
jgi:hypothetical protein